MRLGAKLLGGLAGLCVLASAVSAAPGKTAALATTIGAAKGASRAQLMGKAVTVRGFYIDGQAPRLVKYAGLLSANTMLPPESYLMLAGQAPTGAQTGDEITLTGVLTRPGGKHPPRLRGQTALLELATGTRASVVRKAGSLMMGSAGARPTPGLSAQAIVAARPDFQPIELRYKYAVIINAGNNDGSHWRNRFQVEVQSVRAMLQQRGYTAEGIFVVSGGQDTHGIALGQQRAATVEAVRVLFDQLAHVMGDRSTLVVYVTGFGGGYYDHQAGSDAPTGLYGGILDADGDESHEHTWERLANLDLNGDGDKQDDVAYDETAELYGDEVLTDDELASNVAKITHHDQMVFLLQPSFSGGFAKDLAGPRRVTLSACSEKQWAYAASPYASRSEFTRLLTLGHNRQPQSFYGHMWALYLYIYGSDAARPLETPAYMAVAEGYPHYGGWTSAADPSFGCGWEYF